MNNPIAKLTSLSLALVVGLNIPSQCFAKTETGNNQSKDVEYLSQSIYPDNVYWGDTHLHTNLSIDAYIFGNRRLGIEEAYRFAKGEKVTASSLNTVQLRRPLDFLVIADHASNMGLMQKLEAKDLSVISSALGKEWVSRLQEIASSDNSEAVERSLHLSVFGFDSGQVLSDIEQQSIWKKVTELADIYNDSGTFTALIGYEWTESLFNLHRVVIFKDDAEKVSQIKPFSKFDSMDPIDLWQYLDDYEKKYGGEALAIPHNGNLSQGVMFALEDTTGLLLSPEYAKMRSRWEPLFEVTQIKGDSETHPLISPADQFAEFERLSINNDSLWEQEAINKKRGLNKSYASWFEKRYQRQDATWDYRYGYARPALKLGLQEQSRMGANPFKFGMIGSTDSHTSLATADESNFWGKLSWVEPNKQRVTGSLFGPWGSTNTKTHGIFATAWRMNAAGYTAIWAEENTREALFDAMKRREVYASTGPRIRVRFFGGWDFEATDAFRHDFAHIGYSKGVPMGGDLTDAPKNISPAFLIRAVKDPDGANLDRVQVIKGWHDDQGELNEKIYNVALSDDRQDRGSKTQVVGNTVDIPNASYTNTIGETELAVVWKDPDFNPDELAFYYLRILEIPTPRWTAYDAKAFDLKNIPDHIPVVIQERAYSSPIWYTPAAFAGQGGSR